MGGHFNVVLDAEGKIDGLALYPQKYKNFAFCINSCESLDINFKCSPFIWWNERTDEECIFKSLDRLLINQEFSNKFENIEVDYLAKTESNHSLLLLTCGNQEEQTIRPFMFLMFWVGIDGFKVVEQTAWDDIYIRRSLYKLKILNEDDKNTTN